MDPNTDLNLSNRYTEVIGKLLQNNEIDGEGTKRCTKRKFNYKIKKDCKQKK